MKRTLHAAAVVCLCVVVGQSTSVGQEAATRHPLEPSDTSSPRATLNSMIDACNELYDQANVVGRPSDSASQFLPAADRVRDCLDLSELSSELRDSVGTEAAVYLKEVLDRIVLPESDDVPLATTADGEPVSQWRIPGTRLTIARTQEGPSKGAYLFSAETVRRASRFYSVVKQLPYRSDGPRVSPGFYERYTALTKRQPTLAADTSSPRGTLTLFLDKTNEIFDVIRTQKYIDRADPEVRPIVMQALGCLNLTEVPEYVRHFYAAEAAVCLKEILDRVELPPAEQIPGPEDLKAAASGEPLARWQIPNSEIEIARVAEGPQRGQYLFTPRTVQSAVEQYQKIKDHPYRTQGRPVSEGFYEWFLSAPKNATMGASVDWLPDWFRSRTWGMAVWQWLGLALAVIASVGVMLTVYRIGQFRSEKMREKSLLRYWVTLLFAIVAMLVPLAFNHVLEEHLAIRGTALHVAEFCADVVFLLAVIVVVLGISSRLADSMVSLLKSGSQGLDAHVLRILFRVLGIVAAVIVFLEGGRFLGFPITTLLASAGIGGLAIALSAQGTVKGLFGTVTILLDKPYRVGERIVVKGHDGFVEEIGLRSTKIRTFLTNHVVSIPNDQMADAEIENIGKRKHIRRLCDLHIPLDTQREHVEKAVATIRKVLENHEGMDPDFPPRVYFNEFNPDSFNIRIIYWYTPPELWSYYAFCEKINMEIFRAFEEQGIQFSLPFRHTYWKHDDEQGPVEVSLLANGERSSFNAAERTSPVAE